MIENTAFVNPDASIDIKWKCPLCRHDNEIGSWQFLPSTEQIKAKEASVERIPQQPQDAPQQHQAPQTPEQQAQQEARQAQRLARARALAQAQAREREQGIQARQQLARQQLEERRAAAVQAERQIIETRLSRIDENAPSKFRWVLSLDWKNSIVNHFKAWIMYTSSNYVENINTRPPSGAQLTALKHEHHYEERKRSPQAPWFNFLERTSPP